MWGLVLSRLQGGLTGGALIAKQISKTVLPLGGGFLVELGLVKLARWLDGWSSDCKRNFKKTVLSLGGGFLVGLGLVKVARWLDGWSFDCKRNFKNSLVLRWRFP